MHGCDSRPHEDGVMIFEISLQADYIFFRISSASVMRDLQALRKLLKSLLYIFLRIIHLQTLVILLKLRGL